jgi:hypothetical protein
MSCAKLDTAYLSLNLYFSLTKSLSKKSLPAKRTSLPWMLKPAAASSPMCMHVKWNCSGTHPGEHLQRVATGPACWCTRRPGRFCLCRRARRGARGHRAGCGRRRRAWGGRPAGWMRPAAESTVAIRRYGCGGGAAGPTDERSLATGADGCGGESWVQVNHRSKRIEPK